MANRKQASKKNSDDLPKMKSDMLCMAKVRTMIGLIMCSRSKATVATADPGTSPAYTMEPSVPN